VNVDPYRIAVRALFAYVVLLGLLRAAGKRTVAQGTAFDFVLALVLGDMVDDLLWAEVPAARFTVAVGALTLVHTLVSVLGALDERFDRLLAGAPAPVLEHGRPCHAALRRERVHERELERLLRVEGVPKEGWPEVRRATIEVSGEAAILREPWSEAPRRSERPRLRERER
jgi:uncharacterized membrane protein YcaP (DUF421 family)